MSRYLDEIEIVDKVLKQVGKKIVLGIPLGIGKPNHLVNALYNRAKADPSIDLKICTALTLQRPVGKSDLENRFIKLFDQRVFGDYPDLEYELDRTSESLPDNVKVIEFYFAPGKYLHNHNAQRNYISSNYTHIARDMLDLKVNVIAQMVSQKVIAGNKVFSLSSNPDVTTDLVKEMEEKNIPHIRIAQVNQNLPFIYGDAMVEEEFFNYVLDDKDKYYTLFGPPKMSVSEADYMIGLYCSSLVKDDGEIQIGIGSLGDATIYNLILRQNNNPTYQQILKDLNLKKKYGSTIDHYGDVGIFEKGLFGATEMIVYGFMHLYQNGIVKKKVYDDIGIQRLLNAEMIEEKFSDDILWVLWKNQIIQEEITEEDFDFLVKWGIFREGLLYKNGKIYINETKHVVPKVNDLNNIEFFKAYCLGKELKNGQVMHGGFFLGPQNFYQWLRELPDDEIRLINMKSVQKINQLYGHETLDRLHRKNARFINSCMMYTLGGAAVSDGLEDGRMVSGVGGQYNFVAMAQELPDGHSILNLRSTRVDKGKVVSNILPHYGHITIPKHLRDIVITEYGIAFIRGKTDQEIIKRLLNITDSRFQDQLMLTAKKSGKLEMEYEIPKLYRNNYPESYKIVLEKYKQEGLFPSFPFGTEFTDEEILLGKALKVLKADLHSKSRLIKTLLKSIFTPVSDKDQALLKLMKLDQPRSMKEWIYKKLIAVKLRGR